MGCYTVPAATGLIHYVLMKRSESMKKSRYHLWLSQLLLGGAIFGIVDHAWNRELLFKGENIMMDLFLGLTITVAIFIVWAALVLKDKMQIGSLYKSGE